MRMPADTPVLPYPVYPPSHCRSCHWSAVRVVEGTFCGPVLPPPSAAVPEDVRSAWRGVEGEDLPDPKKWW